jgi:hypothetical protein
LREKRKLRVFKNRMLRQILGLIRDEVTAEWRKIHDEKLSDLHSLYIIQMIKSRRIGWAGRIVHMGRVV